MSYPAIAALEAMIKAGSHQDAVDDMWINIGPIYWKVEDGFITKGLSRPRLASGQMTNVGFREFVNGNVRVIIIEDSFYEYQNPAAEWASKYEQVKSYCGQTRTAEPNNKKPFFVIVTIGKASQFFVYPYGQSELQCLHSLNQAFEFKKDRESVNRWCTWIRDQIKTNGDPALVE